MSATERRGFSLLEVLLATSILLGCVIVLGGLASIGSRRARVAEDLSRAELLCETKMAELLAGAAPVEAVTEEPLEDQPGWVVSIETTPTLHAGVTAIRVTVAAAAVEPPAKAQQVSLVRWVRATTPTATGRRSTQTPTSVDTGPQPGEEITP
jgi:Tfp pilus assembly protein PilV